MEPVSLFSAIVAGEICHVVGRFISVSYVKKPFVKCSETTFSSPFLRRKA
jgi:hypothetical protein